MRTSTGGGRRILLMVLLAMSLSAYAHQEALGDGNSIAYANESPELCFLVLGLGCVAAADICDHSPVPEAFCNFAFDACLDVAGGICFGEDQK